MQLRYLELNSRSKDTSGKDASDKERRCKDRSDNKDIL